MGAVELQLELLLLLARYRCGGGGLLWRKLMRHGGGE